MRLFLVGFLIVGLLIGVVGSKMGKDGDWSDPSQGKHTVHRARSTKMHETNGQQEYAGTHHEAWTGVVGSRVMHSDATGEFSGRALEGVQQQYQSHFNYSDGREQWGSSHDPFTYTGRIQTSDNKEYDFEMDKGTFEYNSYEKSN